jgi:hypothetical protein
MPCDPIRAAAVRAAAIRMGILLIACAILDAVAALVLPHPRIACAIIPTMIPLMMPFVLLPLITQDQA